MFKKGDIVIITIHPCESESFSEWGVVSEENDGYGNVVVKNHRGHYLAIDKDNPRGEFYAGTFTIESLPTSIQFIKECQNGE